MRVCHQFFAFAATACLLAACGGSSTTYQGRNGEKLTMSGDGKNITLKSGDGKTTTSASMSSDYPQDFPVPQYPDSKISNNMTTNTDGKAQKTVMLSTRDDAAKVVQFYKDKLQSAGWKIDNSTDAAGGAGGMSMGAISASKDSSHLQLSAMAGQGDTVISLGLTQ